MFADDDLADGWIPQRELGSIEDALTRALGVVERLSATAQTRNHARRERVAGGSKSLADALRDTLLEIDPRFDT